MDGSFDDLKPAVLDASLRVMASEPAPSKGLREVTNFGANPGALRMFEYVPQQLPKNPALVVILHGCLQNAESYDKGSGWSKLAERGRFVLVYAEQKRSNNPRACFNWFDPADIQRDGGEVCSIRQMIAKAVETHRVDPRRIFICGLSAGGAMTGAMLATYPEVFKGGAIIAGLPYGAATTTSEALESMFTGRLHTAKAWGDFVREASPTAGRWPDIAVWHGTADSTVKPINAGETIKQWTDVHGLGAASPEQTRIGDITLRVWREPGGKARIREYSVPGMAHGTPLGGHGDINDGAIGPYFLAAGLWSSLRIAQDWGLFDEEGKPRKAKRFAIMGFEF